MTQRELIDPVAVQRTLERVQRAADSVWAIVQLGGLAAETEADAQDAAVCELRGLYGALQELRCRLGFVEEVELDTSPRDHRAFEKQARRLERAAVPRPHRLRRIRVV